MAIDHAAAIPATATQSSLDVVTVPTRVRRGGDPFRTLVIAIRWGALAVGAALAAPDIADGDWALLAWGAVLAVHATFRSVRPIDATRPTGLAGVLAEVALTVLAVVATGYWGSPYVPSLVTAVIVAGISRGFGLAVEIALVSAVAVAVPDLLRSEDEVLESAARLAGQWAMVLVLVALVAGWARRISLESAAEQRITLDRLGRLAEANALLYSLHQVAQTLPASLDLDEVVTSTIGRLRDLYHLDAAALYLHEETDDTWALAGKHGTRAAESLGGELPRPFARAVAAAGPVSEANLLKTGGPGVTPRAESGLYAALRARGVLVGLLAVEAREPDRFTERDRDLLAGFAEPAALALDNARWFARLRTVAADEERTRIARDLHDRIGQSLAYVAFELDRVVKLASQGTDVTEPLGRLREDMRGVVGEVRDTLYDLRTEVTEELGVSATLEAYLERVRERSRMVVTFRADETDRLSLVQERELWRIAQEAVTNVERHARARHLAVTWVCDRKEAELVISDDGAGFDRRTAGRLDSYGIIGMRERAASLGARLEVDSTPGFGTTVRCRLRLTGSRP